MSKPAATSSINQVAVTDGFGTYTIPYRSICYYKIQTNPISSQFKYLITTIDRANHYIPDITSYNDFVAKYNTWLNSSTGR